MDDQTQESLQSQKSQFAWEMPVVASTLALILLALSYNDAVLDFLDSELPFLIGEGQTLVRAIVVVEMVTVLSVVALCASFLTVVLWRRIPEGNAAVRVFLRFLLLLTVVAWSAAVLFSPVLSPVRYLLFGG